MPIERTWAIIISALLASVLVGKILWEYRRPERFEAIATFDGYSERMDPRAQVIIIQWPSKRYAKVTVKQLVHSDIGYQAAALSFGLPRELQTTQGRPLVKGQTYSFHLSRRIVGRANYRVKVSEAPTPGVIAKGAGK